jgi:flagellar motor switch protein FliM
MSPRATNNLSKEKIQKLLAVVGAKPAEGPEQIEAADYNWRQPHCFNSKQLKLLENFAQKVALRAAEKFAAFHNSKFDISIVSTTQHFADELLDELSGGGQPDYYLPFGIKNERLSGIVGIPEKTTFIWATQLLGDSKPEEDSKKELSELEQSLLLDLASGLVEAFSSPFSNCEFRPAGGIIKGQWPLDLQGTDELCRISFDVKKAGSQDGAQAYFLITCEKLLPIVKRDTQAAGDLSDEDISNAIIEHLNEMKIYAVAQLASTVLTFEEILNLQVDDILLLDGRIDEPIELIVDDQTICYGWPSKSSGQYALVITEDPKLNSTSWENAEGNAGQVKLANNAPKAANAIKDTK